MLPADTAAWLASALGVTVEYLLSGQDSSRESIKPFFASLGKRSLLRIFDELLPEDQKLTLDFVKLLKKNRDERREEFL